MAGCSVAPRARVIDHRQEFDRSTADRWRCSPLKVTRCVSGCRPIGGPDAVATVFHTVAILTVVFGVIGALERDVPTGYSVLTLPSRQLVD